MDGPLQLDSDDLKGKPVLMFQSLFSWMALFNHSSGLASPAEEKVSILVFMDGPLQHRSVPRRKEKGTVFQSLFSWMALFNLADRLMIWNGS